MALAKGFIGLVMSALSILPTAPERSFTLSAGNVNGTMMVSTNQRVRKISIAVSNFPGHVSENLIRRIRKNAGD